MTTIEQIKKEGIKLQLKKLLQDGYFNIVIVKDVLSLSNCFISSETLEIMRAFHCHKYADMTKETRQWLFEQILEAFTNKGFDMDEFELCDPILNKQIVIK